MSAVHLEGQEEPPGRIYEGVMKDLLIHPLDIVIIFDTEKLFGLTSVMDSNRNGMGLEGSFPLGRKT